MEAVQEESSGYPTQVVPSGARYINPAISDRTEIYEFRSTEPYDPRNCQIPLPLITEEKFGQEESASCYDNVRGMSLTNRIQVEENERTSPVVISSRNL